MPTFPPERHGRQIIKGEQGPLDVWAITIWQNAQERCRRNYYREPAEVFGGGTIPDRPETALTKDRVANRRRAREMRAEGVGVAEIARTLGISRPTVYTYTRGVLS